MQTAGFSGSCHWCTEAIFQCLIGVNDVQQGWLDSVETPGNFSEGVVVYFDEVIISLQTLIAIHLYTHSCTASHSMRHKYRSAVYVYSTGQSDVAQNALKLLQQEYNEPIITQILCYNRFKLNQPEFLNYYTSNPAKPFCERYINPKLKKLMKQFGRHVDCNKIVI